MIAGLSVRRRRTGSRRAAPKVVEFQDPSTTSRSKSSSRPGMRKQRKAGGFLSSAVRRGKKRVGEGTDDVWETKYTSRKRDRTESEEFTAAEVHQMWQSVKALGAAKLTGKDKWKYEMQKLMEIGVRAPKGKKTPYYILKGMRQKANQREAKREKEIAESGVVVANSQKKKRRKRERKDFGASDTPEPSIGRFKGGMLRIGAAERRAVTGGGGGGRRR